MSSGGRNWPEWKGAPCRQPLGAQFDYWFRLNEENGLRPNIPDSLDCIGRMCRTKKVLLAFATRLSRSALQKRNASILGRIRRYPLKCQKGRETAHEETNDSSAPLLRISRSECSGTRFKHGRFRWLWHGRERN